LQKRKENWNLKNGPKLLYAVLALTGGLIGGLVTIEAAPTLALAAKHARSVKAEQFVLVDSTGAERAKLELTQPGDTAELAMMDGGGKTRAEFRVAKDGSSAIAFYDQNGMRRVVIGADPAGRNGLAISSANGRQVATLSSTQSNESSLTLYDPDTGRARVGLGMTATGAPALVLFDEGGKDRLELHINAKGNPGIALADESGKTVSGLPERSAPEPQ
jgi:hypothetical protein